METNNKTNVSSSKFTICEDKHEDMKVIATEGNIKEHAICIAYNESELSRN